MSESYPVCCRTCKHYHEHDHQCRLNPKWYNVYQIDEHYCNYHEYRQKAKGFEVGKCYKSVDNIYFKPNKIIDELAIGEGLFEDKHSTEKRVDINYRQFWQEISEEEYEDAVAPHRPKPLVVEAGHAYEFYNGNIMYVVELNEDGNPIGDFLNNDDKRYQSYYNYKQVSRIKKQIVKEISLSEWFERTREHNPGWQVGGYYRSESGIYVHVLHKKFGCSFPTLTIHVDIEYCPCKWTNAEFKGYKFLPISQREWDERLAEVSA